MSDKMQRGKKQVMYSFPPDTTFSNPKHDLIEKAAKMTGDQIEIASKDEIIDAVRAKLDNWDGGVESSVPPPTQDRWAIIDPQYVFSEIFPLVFRCQECDRVHDYSENGFGNLEDNGSECQNPDCDGNITQIHHVGVCPSCSAIKSVHVPRCDDHGYQHIKLDDRADRYQGFKWRCDAEYHNDTVVSDDFLTFCDCGENMHTTVHSSSKALNIHDLTRVDLSGTDLYQQGIIDENELDELLIGAYLDEFPHPQTSLREIALRDGFTDIDPDSLDQDEDTIQAAKEMLGQVGEGADPNLVRATVKQNVGSVNPSDNMRRYIQLQEKMDQTSAREDASKQEKDLMDSMGIHDIGITSEFPLLKSVYGYHRTYENREEGDPEPSARLFPMVKVNDGDWRRPIYTTRSETEAAIVQLDPRAVGHWLSEAGYEIEDTNGMDIKEARATLYKKMDPVDPRSTDINDDDNDYSDITIAVHRLLHTISHLLLQRAAVHSGIEETSFGEYLFTEALTTAIYSNNTENYTAGGLFTLVERNLGDWLSSTLREGEHCVYDSTCANIRGGACHACLHISEIGCQYFNKNLSRTSLYGKRITTEAPDGFWKLTGSLTTNDD